MSGVRIFLLLLLALSSHAEPIDPIKQSITSLMTEIQTSDNQKESQLIALIDRYINPHIDHLRMSQLILGEHWKRSSMKQKKQFLDCFPRQFSHLQMLALIQWQPDTWGFQSEVYNENRTKLAYDIKLSKNNESKLITLRLNKVDQAWLIYDAAFEDLSLLKTFRDDYAEKINRLGLKRTLAKVCNEYPEKIKDLTLAGLQWPPFIGRGLPGQGLSVELVSAVLESAGYHVKTVFAPWKRVIEGMKSGEFDVNLAIWKSKKREKYLNFSQPYFTNTIVAISHSSKYLNTKNLKQTLALKGSLGIMDDYAYSHHITQYPNRQYFTSYPTLFRELINQSLDFALLDKTVGQFYIEQNDALKQGLQVSTITLESKPLHISMLKAHPASEQVLSDFNRYLKKYLKSPAYQALLIRYKLEK
ncbi:hypothetical protein NBRC116188_20760 [Oceaniserpentilla sp. 4NH20-0058]|uniref:ABC transporter substrate-binding protein n=1 Tax=Oceaniserpentilla sp. 4NH20-0058 TaxID=3127660 RepID=UPI00310BDF77